MNIFWFLFLFCQNHLLRLIKFYAWANRLIMILLNLRQLFKFTLELQYLKILKIHKTQVYFTFSSDLALVLTRSQATSGEVLR
jgi:hypothetical protein